MSKLAINGGDKVRKLPFPAYKPLGEEEVEAVSEVVKSGILSRFLGAWHEDFYGGPNVKSLESEWKNYFGVRNAVSVNSASSGLIAALGAVGVGPGDEVIVTPYSMCISATAPLFYGAVPVFADIEPDLFCLDSDSVEEKITEKTKAIIVVDLFGQPYDVKKINNLAKKHNLVIIEDASQAPQAKFDGKYAGTLGDIGVYSFNYHKHIHCGEGGMVVTNNDGWAERLRLIRNHAEAAVAGREDLSDLSNMVGFNMRLGEMEAAIVRIQLKKLNQLVKDRIKNVEYIKQGLEKIDFIQSAKTREGATHSYYLHVFTYNQEKADGVNRNSFVDAVKAELTYTENREAEGVKVSSGYVRPLNQLPIFQNKIAFGNKGYPFSFSPEVDYSKGICPVVELCHEKTLFFHDLMHPNMTKQDLDDVILAFQKVSDNISELKN
ncbi:DegT/DnrJ/EryC1/StrS family aminotransferase [Candidatus Kaiserbacteria bacterium]|nr:DegT/DnrJ/EryC1/StrS family aminotransferase [Candidatus Kaiserbacteria bacterium]